MANNTISIQNLVGIIKDIAVNHKEIKSFFYGKLDKIPDNQQYPLLLVQPNDSTMEFGEGNAVINYNFDLTVFDVLDKNNENYLQLISDTNIWASSIVAFIKQHRMFIDLQVKLNEDVTFIPVVHQTTTDLIGHSFTLSMLVPARYTPCNTPIEPITGWQTAYNYEINNYLADMGKVIAEPPLLYDWNGERGLFSLEQLGTTNSTIGSSASIPIITYDKYGRIINATYASINSELPDIIEAGTVGDSNKIPVITYDSKGRITKAVTQTINTSLNVVELDASPDLNTNKLIFPNGSISATTSGVEVLKFNGRRPITRSGYTGVNLNTDNINQFIEEFFFPAVPPTLSLSANNTSRELGSSTAVTLSWSVTKRTRGISAITAGGVSQAVPTNIDNDNDTDGAVGSGTQAVNTAANTNTTYTLLVTDSASNNFSTTVTITYFNKRYWGRLTNFSASDAEIIAAVGGGSEFSTTRVQTRNGLNGSGDYLFFAFPSSFGTPTFTVNGLPNTAWTKIRSNSAFVNASGYSNNYDVWISNTKQNSPLNIVVS